MNKKLKCIISALLAVIMTVMCASTAFAAVKTDCGDACENCPTIIVPGVFQSDVKLYNDDGTVATNKDGEEYSEPFYLDTTSEIVIDALKNVFFPMMSVLFFQQDFNDKFAKTFGETAARIVGEKVQSDSEGNPIYNIEAVHYNASVAECSEADRAHIMNAIPLESYVDIVGADHLYFFSYYSLGNMNKNTAELYSLIQQVKEETGHDKVNIVPISQGGSLCNNLLEYYPQVADDLNRIIYVVPAVDGTSILGDIYTEGLLDDADALYGYMMPMLTKDDLQGKAINLALRMLPSSVLNKALDYTADALLGKYIKNSTMMWALVPSGQYEAAADKYLSGDENSVIRAQTDAYHKAQLNYKSNILKMREAGVEVFDIVDYNVALYPICDSWNKANADGVINISSTSMGAYSVAVDAELPEGYTQQGNSYGTCSDPAHHNHIDSHNLVDASTGLLPDNTFYYYDGNHERTASNDSLIKLVIRLLTDETFTDVYSYPEEFPQFNTARVSKGLIKDADSWRIRNTADLSAEDAAELSAAIAEVDAVIANTNVDIDAFNHASERFYNITDKINGIEAEKESGFTKLLTKVVNGLSDFVEKKVGNKGYSD